MIEDKNSNCYTECIQQPSECIENLLENNYVTCLTFEGINTVTELWQQAKDIREGR